MQSKSISKDKQTQSGRLSKRQIVFLVLSVLFASMIFCFSARNGVESTEDSYTVGMEFGRIIHPDFKNWPEEAQLAFAAKVDHPIRKLAHATEYAVFAMLLCGVWLDARRKRKLSALFAWGTATVYAATDEFHQLFVPGRSGQVKDALLDSCGAAVGVLLLMFVLWLVSRKRQKRAKMHSLANKTIDN